MSETNAISPQPGRLTAAGMGAGLIGLAVTLPLAGHATWHAYRAVIRPDRSEPGG